VKLNKLSLEDHYVIQIKLTTLLGTTIRVDLWAFFLCSGSGGFAIIVYLVSLRWWTKLQTAYRNALHRLSKALNFTVSCVVLVEHNGRKKYLPWHQLRSHHRVLP
jgi:hypothetical protein